MGGMNEDEFREWADHRVQCAQADAECAAAYYKRLRELRIDPDVSMALVVEWVRLVDNERSDETARP